MAELLLIDKLSQAVHPLEGVAFHEAAPFTDQDRSNVLIGNVKPERSPGILLEGFICEFLLKPGLLIDSRAVIVR